MNADLVSISDDNENQFVNSISYVYGAIGVESQLKLILYELKVAQDKSDCTTHYTVVCCVVLQSFGRHRLLDWAVQVGSGGYGQLFLAGRKSVHVSQVAGQRTELSRYVCADDL